MSGRLMSPLACRAEGVTADGLAAGCFTAAFGAADVFAAGLALPTCLLLFRSSLLQLEMWSGLIRRPKRSLTKPWIAAREASLPSSATACCTASILVIPVGGA